MGAPATWRYGGCKLPLSAYRAGATPSELPMAIAPIAVVAATLETVAPNGTLLDAEGVPCIQANARCGETAKKAQNTIALFPE
jgi:hypothetical protein